MPYPSEWRQHFICFSRRQMIFFFSNEVYTLKLPAHISTAQSPNIVTTLRIKARGLPNIFLRFEAAEEEAALSPEAQIHFGTHLYLVGCWSVRPCTHVVLNQQPEILFALTDGCCFRAVGENKKKKRKQERGLFPSNESLDVRVSFATNL